MLGSRAYLLAFIPLLIWCEEAASASEVADSLRSGSGSTFANFRYRAYYFSPTLGGVRFRVVMRSKMFDPYLMVIRPDGSILTNDDHDIAGVVQSGRDAGIAVENPAKGRWTVVATSLDPDTEGDYILEYEGVPSLTADFAYEGSKELVAAFAARDVHDPTLRRDALVEQLTLRSFRLELRRRLQAEIARIEKESVETRALLSSHEENQRQLSKAMESISRLKEAKDLIRDLVERSSITIADAIEYVSKSLVTFVSTRNALAVALGELDKLDVVDDELKAQEALLLGTNPTDGAALRSAIVRLRGERETVSKALAEKLLASRVVMDLRFGGFSVLDLEESKRTSFSFFAGPQGHSGQGSFQGGNYAQQPQGQSGQGGQSFNKESIRRRPAIDASVWLPALLPWPPPDPSSRVVLERRFLADRAAATATLGDVADRLQAALSGAGYSGSGYWGVPRGFAIVTPLEQTNSVGNPLAGAARWVVSIAEMKSFSLAEYLRALFTAPPGYFRVLVFVTSSEPFAPSGSRARLETIERWSQGGFNFLPDTIRAEAFTERHRVTVLVYEFLKRLDADRPDTSVPGRLTAPEHLRATNLAVLADLSVRESRESSRLSTIPTSPMATLANNCLKPSRGGAPGAALTPRSQSGVKGRVEKDPSGTDHDLSGSVRSF